ncbi:MAG: hypothetical protein ACREX8_20110, partial [Gammaproteobacteria bacterium]
CGSGTCAFSALRHMSGKSARIAAMPMSIYLPEIEAPYNRRVRSQFIPAIPTGRSSRSGDGLTVQPTVSGA